MDTPYGCGTAHGMKAAKERTEKETLRIVENSVAGKMASVKYWNRKSKLGSLSGVLLTALSSWVLVQALVAVAYQTHVFEWSDPDDIILTFQIFNIISLAITLVGFGAGLLLYTNDEHYSDSYYIAQYAPYVSMAWVLIPQFAYTGSNFAGHSVTHFTNALSSYVDPVPFLLVIFAFGFAMLRWPALEAPTMDFINRTAGEIRASRPWSAEACTPPLGQEPFADVFTAR